jgi:hypothetical protein
MRGPTQAEAVRVYESLSWLGDRAAPQPDVKRVAAMLAAMDVDPSGIEFAGDRAKGTIIDHRFADSWLVSFRPTGPGRDGTRYYRNPVDAAAAIVAGEHNDRGEVKRP